MVGFPGNSPEVAIVVVMWNNYYDTSECIESILGIEYPSYRIIVVDNNSNDGSPQKVEKTFPECYFIYNSENLGYAGGNNVGIRAAFDMGVSYIWLVNNDVVVDRFALFEMVKVADSEADIGIMGSKVYYYEKRNVLSFIGGDFNKWTGLAKQIGIGETDIGQHDSQQEVGYIIGCNILLRRTCLEDVGLFDEKYFLYYEETDFCLRAKQSGWRIVSIPVAGVWHKISASQSDSSLTSTYYLARNRLYFVQKHFPSHLPVALLVSLRYCFFNHIIKKRWNQLRVCLLAYRDFFLHRMGEASLLSYRQKHDRYR